MKSKENWQKVGEVLEKLCGVGLFPIIGLYKNGWEAWVLVNSPVEGVVGRVARIYAADTATEAAEKLLVNVLSSHVKGSYLDGLLDCNSNT